MFGKIRDVFVVVFAIVLAAVLAVLPLTAKASEATGQDCGRSGSFVSIAG